MKNTTFKKFIASLGIAVLVTSNVGSAIEPLAIYAAEETGAADEADQAPSLEASEPEAEPEPASVEETEHEGASEESADGSNSDNAAAEGTTAGQESNGSEKEAGEAEGAESVGTSSSEVDEAAEKADEIDTSDESSSLGETLDEDTELNDSVNKDGAKKKEKRDLTVKVSAVKVSGGNIVAGEEELSFDEGNTIDLTKNTDEISTEIEINGCKYIYADATYNGMTIAAIKTNIKSETESEIITETKFTSDINFRSFTEDSAWSGSFDDSDISAHKAVITLNYNKEETPSKENETVDKTKDKNSETASTESTEDIEKTEEAGKDASQSKEESSEASSTQKTEEKTEDTSNKEETASTESATEETTEEAIEGATEETTEDITEETDKKAPAEDSKTENKDDEKSYEITATFKEYNTGSIFTFDPVDGSNTVTLELVDEQVSVEDISAQYYEGTMEFTSAWIGLNKVASLSNYGYVRLNGDGEVIPYTTDTNVIFKYSPEKTDLLTGLKKKLGIMTLAVQESKLEDIASITVTSNDELTNVDRNGSFRVNVLYEIKNSSIGAAKENRPWVYDISSLTGEGSYLEKITGSGYLMDGNSIAGTYEVRDGKVYISPSDSWIADKTEDIKGAFSLNLKFDENKVNDNEKFDITFPGSDTISGTFKEITGNTSKEVSVKDGNGKIENGIVYQNASPDGTHTLHYKTTIETNAALDSIVLTDTMNQGQYVTSPVKVQKEWDSNKSNTVTANGNPFTVDIVKALAAYKENDKLPAGRYSVEYDVIVPVGADLSSITNNATWEYAGKTSESNTNVSFKKEITVNKSVSKEGDSKYNYTITVGDGSTNLAGYTIKDVLTGNQKPDGTITISPAVNGSSTIEAKWDGTGDSNDNEQTYIKYTFPTNGEFKGPYTITYSTSVEDVNLENWHDIRNKVTVTNPDGDKGEDSTSEKHDFGQSPTKGIINKSFKEFDLDNNIIYWEIEINKTDDAEWPLSNVVVTETDLKYDYGTNAQYNRNNQMTVDWSKLSAAYKDGTAVQPVVDEKAKSMSFASLTGPVVITVATKLNGEDTINNGGTAFWTSNKASLTVDGKTVYSEAKKEYVSSDYTIQKSGEYDEANQVFNWTVVINPNKIKYEPDFKVWFSDDLPSGHEMVKNSIHVDVEWTRSYDLTVTVTDGKIDAVEVSHYKNPYEELQYGASGYKYIITYKTKLTDDEKNAILGNPQDKQYTNTAYWDDKADASATVEKKFDYVDKKDAGIDKDIITYVVNVNNEGVTLNNGNNLTLKDTISDNVSLLTNSITVKDTDGNDVSCQISYENGTLIITVPDNKKLTVTYQVQALNKGNQTFSNTVVLTGTGSWESSTSEQHNVSEHSGTITATNATISLKKIDQDDITKTLGGAKFDLYEIKKNNAAFSESKKCEGESNAKTGLVEFEGLVTADSDTLYHWKETKSPAGYKLDENSEGYFVLYERDNAAAENKAKELAKAYSEASGKNVSVLCKGISFTVSNKKEENISIEGTKTWDDNNNQDGKRPSSIEVQLYKQVGETGTKEAVDGKKATVTADADGNWSYTFDDLPKYENGTEITYSVEETAVTGYTPTYDGMNIINTYTPEKISVSGTKTWSDNDNQDGKRPEKITVNLLADGTKVASKEVSADKDGKWTYTFDNLPKNSGGKAITYTVTEEAVENYTAKVSGYNITNSYTPEVTSISGTKTWDDGGNRDGKRPASITVNLLADGTKVASKEVSADKDGKWTYTFDNLPKNSGGKAIVYTVTEEAVENYTAKVSGYNITNSYTPEVTSISGTKTWDDGGNRDGKRPASITVNLLADGTKVASKEVSADKDGKWTYTFDNLPKNSGGKAITYTVTEEAVENYTAKVSGYNITNSHTPEVTSVSGTKTWDDGGNRDGKRPEKITVNLLADGTKVASKEVSADKDGKWTYTFDNLPKNSGGKAITYTVTEEAVENYTAKVSGYNITNSHTPEVTSVSGTKTWDDGGNRDGKRPEKITVNLLADGTKVASKEVSADKDGKWTYTFDNLPKNSGGKAITYTVTEEAVENYTAKVSGYNITNSYTPEVTSISGTKTWDDGGNRDGKRPEKITVNLLADGTKVASKEVSADKDGKWTYTFDNLPKNSGGKAITYTVTEEAVENYTAKVSGYNITNSYTPEVTSISGTKTWDDGGNRDGKRPEKITVNLLADGTKVASKEVSADKDGKWTYTFDNLPKNSGGKAITYTVTEEAVENYTAKVSGYNITNSHTPEVTSVSGTKTWEDNNDQDGKRPSSIEVQLYKQVGETGTKEAVDGKKATVTADADGNWSYTFDDLPKYENGTEITYSVGETAVTGYAPTYDGMNITNTHTPAKTEASVEKKWEDYDNKDGIRPEKLTVKLLANGKEHGSYELNADNNWSYAVHNLNKYADGKIVNYEWSEVVPEGYEIESQTKDGNTTVITNKHTPLTKISVKKVWSDFNNASSTRPGSVNVQLKANGENKGEAVVLSEINQWSYTWTGLVNDGTSYTVEEVGVPSGYVVSYSGDAANGYVITNTLPKRPEKVSIPASKIWTDGNNADGIRPSQIRVHLYADGEQIASAVITEGSGWSYSFKDLDKYAADGHEIVYTLTEDTVNGYETTIGRNTIGGFNITNTRTTTPPGGEGGNEGGEEGGGFDLIKPNAPRDLRLNLGRVPRNLRLGLPMLPRRMRTGDDGQMPVYGSLSIASLGALFVWFRRRRKRSA